MTRRTLRVASFLKWSIGLTGMVGLALTFGCPTGTGGGGGDQNQPPEQNVPTTGDSGLTGKFIGASTCALCHSNLEESWSATQHAKALESLEAVGQGTNPACLVCHTTGNGQSGGFVNRATTNSLAGVQCEACHGPGRDHRENVADRSLRPPVTASADVCAQCHNAFHHTLYAEWQSSGHGSVSDHPGDSFVAGSSLNSCGVCHSGDFRLQSVILGNTVPDTFLEGMTIDELSGVTCAICHDPHERTNNATNPQSGHDWQLRYAEVHTLPTIPSSSLADAQDETRFNLCGQCHHSRNSTWTGTSRGPHHSIQSNFFYGEMPVPDGTPALVNGLRTVHAFVAKQCVTCHMQQEQNPSDHSGNMMYHAGHEFTVAGYTGCSATGCHTTPDDAEALKTALQAEIQAGLDDIANRLGDPATWQYSAEGGPSDQTGIPTEIKKVRFMYDYILNDGSLGVHNPFYARAIITECGALLTSIGK